MKADKGNCFVVMDRPDYNEKMETLLSDHQTYQMVHKPPFAKIERELNHKLLDLNKKGKIDDSTYYELLSTDERSSIPMKSSPAIRGSIKHHKAGHPLRPIVSCIGSALYNTSKFLTGILTPIQNLNGYSVSNSMDFTKQVANQEIAEDELMVPFDVFSLFTAIPVDKACDYIRKKLDEDTTLHSRTKLNADEIISLLEFTLSNNYFMFNDSVYKQIHGCAMGSPVSPVVASLCTNSLRSSATVRDCAEEIVNLAAMISNESSADLAISAIIPRSDNEVLAVKVSGVKKILKTFCNQNGWGYVDQSNISPQHDLNRSGLHLNTKGTARLATNFINYLRGD